MTDLVQVAIIGAIATIAVAVINSRIMKVEHKVNGRMDELLDLTRRAGEAKGDLKGRKDLKEEQKNNKHKKP